MGECVWQDSRIQRCITLDAGVLSNVLPGSGAESGLTPVPLGVGVLSGAVVVPGSVDRRVQPA